MMLTIDVSIQNSFDSAGAQIRPPAARTSNKKQPQRRLAGLKENTNRKTQQPGPFRTKKRRKPPSPDEDTGQADAAATDYECEIIATARPNGRDATIPQSALNFKENSAKS